MNSITKRTGSLLIIFVTILSVVYFFMLRGSINFPKMLQIGPVLVYMYSVFILMGIGLTALLFDKEKKKQPNLNKIDTTDALLWIITLAIVFARLWHVVTDFYLYQDNLIEILSIWNGGLGIFGGILGGFIGAWIYSRKVRVSLTKPLALVAVFLPLGQVVGRFGNFANRELYGSETNLPWGLYLEEYGKNFHPTFAYEQLGNLFLFILLYNLYRKFGLKKEWINLYLIGYSLVRFSVDFSRMEPRVWLGLTVAQIVCLLLAFVNIVYLTKIKK